ncbi:hypothetical protein HanIR_Chr06g0269311 [Helianthus annuus]|nr:hypothetical protein HanIR_Chr06g0269311 [Helianthus annuus]
MPPEPENRLKSSQNIQNSEQNVSICFYNILRSHGRANKLHDHSLLNHCSPCLVTSSDLDRSSLSHDRSVGGTLVHLRVRVARVIERAVHSRGWAGHRIRTGCNHPHDRSTPRLSHPNRWRNHRGAALSETDCPEVSTTTIITNSVK